MKDIALIIIVGVFHFGNPQNDAVKTDQIDVTTEQSQTYLEAVTREFAKFGPTAILHEFHPKVEADINEKYQQYLSDNLELATSETHQLGFRIGKYSGAKHLHGIDEWRPLMKFSEMMEYMEASDPVALQESEELLKTFAEEDTKAHQSMSLQELLIRANRPESERKNKALYISTNSVGAGDGFVGADASAAWWNRNFRMYANVQRHIKPGARIIVIVGAGHAGILRDLAEIDSNVNAVDVIPYLELSANE